MERQSEPLDRRIGAPRVRKQLLRALERDDGGNEVLSKI
jgi:hypothetical protein